MIEPFRANDDLLTHIRTHNVEDGFRVWWLGQSGFLLKFAGKFLLFDPYLSDSLTRKYEATDKPHVRMTELAIDPWRLDFIDVVTSSHNHTDHLDAETLVPLMKSNPGIHVVVPTANRLFAANRLEVQPERLDVVTEGESLMVPPFEICAVPAAHETVERNELGQCRFVGYIARFGNWTVYHSGDTMLYDGMLDLLRNWEIDLAFLPINGRAPERRVAGNLWGREAAQLASDIGAKMAVPCHYEMFEFNTAAPDEFVQSCKEQNQDFRVLRCGEHLDIH